LKCRMNFLRFAGISGWRLLHLLADLVEVSTRLPRI
jgi:hypothetical protein